MRIQIVTVVLLFLFTAFSSAQSFNPEIRLVCVDTLNPVSQGEVNILWEPMLHAEVNELGVYKISDQGSYLLIERVGTDITSYKYSQAKADQASKGFSMVSFSDNPDLPSQLVDWHFTVFVQVKEFNYCNKTLTIEWNNYQGWGANIESYSIYRKKNTNPYQLISTIPFGGDTVFTEQNVEYNSIYKYHIVAKSTTGEQSLSNISQIITDPHETVELNEFYLDTVLFDGSKVNLSFNVDESDQLAEFEILSSNEPSGTYAKLESIAHVQNTRYRFEDENADKNHAKYYKVSVKDECNDLLSETNTVRQVILTGSSENNIVNLDWNYAFNELDEVFDVMLSADGRAYEVIDQFTAGNHSVSYNLIELGGEQVENLCLKVAAQQSNSYYSESNTLCYTVTPEVVLPNAFTPNGDGINDYISPEIKYADINEYTFIIYDSYGGKIFETGNVQYKWDGKVGDKQVKEGAYLYYISFKTRWGNNYEKSGTINVLYP